MARGSGLFQEKEERENPWKGLARDALIAGAIVAIVLGALYAYAGVWPPLVVVESSSMQHSDQDSSLGVIDTGDMVFQQAAPTTDSIVTYVRGRATGYATYGDFGDVIIFRRGGSSTPVIHRAILYVILHVVTENGTTRQTADVPEITSLSSSEWYAWNRSGGVPTPTRSPMALAFLAIQHMGVNRAINLTFNFDNFPKDDGRAGYVTMGDNNLRIQCNVVPDPCRERGYDPSWIPRIEDVQGRARGEIPWLGLLKLTLQPTESCCPRGWGSTGLDGAPKNSWDSLLLTLIGLVLLPFVLEYAGRGWKKFVSPHMPKINWPWKKKESRIRLSDPTDAEGNPSTWDEPIDDEVL
jgi:signal peptidase I